MPKRKNPFGEITPLQRKTHVGFEQMATQQEREEVYEKTKALLFQGANPTMDTSRVLGLAVHIPQHGIQSYTNTEGATNGHTCASQPGLFTADGRLSAFPGIQGTNGITSPDVGGSRGSQTSAGGHHLGLLNHFTSSQNSARAALSRVQCQRRSGGRQVCCGCRRQCMVDTQLCDHCEKSVCGDCCRQCCVCQTLFCPFCSVLNYDEAVVRTFCLNCLPISS